MSKKTAILMTVGTSLIENIRKKRIEEMGRFINQNNKTLTGANPAEIINALYECFFGELKKKLNQWNPSAPFPSAEVQSFCFWLAGQPKDSITLSDIILMPTETEFAKVCAEKVKKILGDEILKSNFGKPYLSNAGVNIPDPEPFRLRLEDETNFAEDVANFLNKLRQKMGELEEKGVQRIVLNITGGYKGVTPFFSLIGFLEEGIEVIYQHEEANVVLRVPPLPLAWDFKLFDEYRSLLRAEDKHMVTTPPDKFRVLFDRKDSKWAKNPFGKILEDIYTKDRLKRFGYGARLIRRLPEQLKKELIEYRIPRWEHIWIGDQIPETVEHSRGHSQRVMEYAASLLEPRFNKDQKFLSDEELYCLICCLWLHDIGHTVLTYRLPNGKDIPFCLFPTLVRKFHHILSYERIMDNKYNYLPKNEREVVALISKYDRATMPLVGEDKEWDKGKDFRLTAKPLENEIRNDGLSFRNEKITKDRLLLLCALLRIIDALDVQSDRVIDKNYWLERKQRTVEEVEHCRDLLSKRFGLLEMCSNDFKKRIDCLKKQLDQIYDKWEESLKAPDGWEKADKVRCEIEDEVEPKLVKVVSDALYLDDTKGLEREMLLGVLSLLDRMSFKMIQEAHFRKHSRVKLVYLTYREESSSNATTYQIQMVFDNDISITNNQKQKIADEIWKEVKKVNNILCDAGIIFEGIFEEDKNLLPGGRNTQ